MVRIVVGVALVAAVTLPIVESPVAQVAAQPAPAPAVGASATYRWTATARETMPVLVEQRDASGQVTRSVVQEPVAPPPIYVTYAIVKAAAKTYTLQMVTSQAPEGTPLSVTQVVIDKASGKSVRSVIGYPKGVIATPESALRPLRESAVPQGAREDVTVPAGGFTAVRGRAQDAEVWVADQVPALGLVKAVWPSGMLELVGSAPSGAKDLLAGK
jgi:hypothetical protein